MGEERVPSGDIPSGDMPSTGIPSAAAFEKLGAFYLGRAFDIDAGTRGDELVMYDSRDLLTHAVCVGMTGSGKTGLCIALLEEAAIDGIPAIIIDPKGDLANLMLTFEGLSAAEFRPWINEDDARRKGLDPDAFAKQQAEAWAKGLARSGQDATRIAKLRAAAEVQVYTPGSTAGVPMSVLASFDPPKRIVGESDQDVEALRERVSAMASSLLALASIDADPVRSPEHLLLSGIFMDAWSVQDGQAGNGKSLDLAEVIARVQRPPFTRLGVMDLEAMYPAKERFALAMALNALAASSSFEAWTKGEPLDIGALLASPTGKPRLSVLSIAHLSESERMFFVTLVMNEVLAWTRRQSGTTSLRAIVYMDEIAGYVPPVANPPSKRPMLTLMKQARAYGVGMVLASQNPVDLDYKGLSNAGTWLIGRLQTDRDKQRLLDGLEGASAGVGGGSGGGGRFDRANMDRLLSKLGSRVFLMHNVHDARVDGEPRVFESRWCMSYLAGPMTRTQIRTLMTKQVGASAGSGVDASRLKDLNEGSFVTAAAKGSASRIVPNDGVYSGNVQNPGTSSGRPVMPPDVPEYFLPTRGGARGVTPTYSPSLLCTGRVAYVDAKLGIDTTLPVSLLVPLKVGPVPADFEHAIACECDESDLEHEPVAAARFMALPPEATRGKSYEAWKRAFADWVFQSSRLELLAVRDVGLTSKPEEREGEFRARVALACREQRDAEVEALRAKIGPKLATLQERARRAEQAVDVQRAQASRAKANTALSFGSAILGAFLGRKTLSAGNVGRAASAAKGVGRSRAEAQEVDRAEETVDAIRAKITQLERVFMDDAREIVARHEAIVRMHLERITLKPKKSGITVRAVVLAWSAED